MPSKAAEQRQLEKARQDLGPHISVEVEGKHYLLSSRDMTGLDVRAMREQTGYSFRTLLKTATEDWDVDLLAVTVWMSRRLNGEKELTYDEVASQLTWEKDWKFVPAVTDADVSSEAGDDESPEG